MEVIDCGFSREKLEHINPHRAEIHSFMVLTKLFFHRSMRRRGVGTSCLYNHFFIGIKVLFRNTMTIKGNVVSANKVRIAIIDWDANNPAVVDMIVLYTKQNCKIAGVF